MNKMIERHDSRLGDACAAGDFSTEVAARNFALHTGVIISNDAVNDEYFHMDVEAPRISAIARPGQFCHLHCPATEGHMPYLRRPMSLYDIDPARGRISFLYKLVGKGTHSLATLRAGAALDLLGPLGRGFELPKDCRHVLQIARGVGLATLAPIAGHARTRGIAVTAILSARRLDLLMSEDLLRAQGAQVITVTDSAGDSSPEALEPRIDALICKEGGDMIVTCGSNRLLKLARRLCARHGISGQVALEEPMGCGIGMCFVCVRNITLADGSQAYKRVCWDGPVFDIAEVGAW